MSAKPNPGTARYPRQRRLAHSRVSDCRLAFSSRSFATQDDLAARMSILACCTWSRVKRLWPSALFHEFLLPRLAGRLVLPHGRFRIRQQAFAQLQRPAAALAGRHARAGPPAARASNSIAIVMGRMVRSLPGGFLHGA
ncbi:MAG: hypothetical protein K0S48_3464, partial [Ramlibacter sp.]|nr:hypothetical protein [Ramlibacter sp.]